VGIGTSEGSDMVSVDTFSGSDSNEEAGMISVEVSTYSGPSEGSGVISYTNLGVASGSDVGIGSSVWDGGIRMGVGTGILVAVGKEVVSGETLTKGAGVCVGVALEVGLGVSKVEVKRVGDGGELINSGTNSAATNTNMAAIQDLFIVLTASGD